MGNRNFEIREKPKKRKFIPFQDLILFENEDVIILNKPAGFTTVPERWDTEAANLYSMGLKYHPGIQVCHRLDRMTTGVLVFAKNPEAHRFINLQFQDRETVKHYLALVEGVRDFKEYMIDAPITVSAAGKVKIDNLKGKDAVTVVDTAEVFRHYTLLDCQPLTGRTHQVRIHLSAVACPIVGDKEYGGKDIFLSSIKRGYKVNRTGEEEPMNEGYMLHARGLFLTLPGKEEPELFVAPLPDHFEVTLKMLRKYDS